MVRFGDTVKCEYLSLSLSINITEFSGADRDGCQFACDENTIIPLLSILPGSSDWISIHLKSSLASDETAGEFTTVGVVVEDGNRDAVGLGVFDTTADGVIVLVNTGGEEGSTCVGVSICSG